MITITELLGTRGLDCANTIKLVRHQDPRFPLQEMYRRGYLDLYQEYQGKPVFRRIHHVVAFLGLERTLAIMIGVYKVGEESPLTTVPTIKGYPYPEAIAGAKYHYNLTKCRRFCDLENRVIIDWGKATRSWHQKLRDREVIEILPTGYVREYPGYEDIVLDHGELRRLIASPLANREWHKRLSAVAGVYLIADTKTGQLYVGSAYGKEGILGRWTQYAKTGHGGNARLKALLASRPDALFDLRFSILRTLPRDLTAKEVVQYESRYKEKLGSMAFGLNCN